MALILRATGNVVRPFAGSTSRRLGSADETEVARARAELRAMAPEALLQEARALGLTVTVTDAGTLRVRGPDGTRELAGLVLARKDEVLPLLTAPPAAAEVVPDEFANELARLLARLDRVEAGNNPLLTRPHRNVLSVIRQQLREYAARRDAGLWDCEAWLTGVLRDRWGITER